MRQQQRSHPIIPNNHDNGYDEDLDNGNHHMEDMSDNYNNNNDNNNIQSRQQQQEDNDNNSYDDDNDQYNNNTDTIIDTNVPLGVHQRTATTTNSNKTLKKNVNTNGLPKNNINTNTKNSNGFSAHYNTTGNRNNKNTFRHRGGSRGNISIPNDILIAIVTTFICTTIIMIILFPLLFHNNHNISSNYNIDNINYDPTLSNNEIKALEEEKVLGLQRLPYLLNIYRIPESMETVGERSAQYSQLRELYDTTLLPKNNQRSLQFVTDMNKHHPTQYVKTKLLHEQIQNPNEQEQNEEGNEQENANTNQIYHTSYDINNCPNIPPIGYPYQWNLLEILTNWPTDDTELPEIIYQGLCIFDYNKDYDKALNYRIAELPFVVKNDPEVARTVERWNDIHFMEGMLGTVPHRTEYSMNNHFMYYVPPSKTGNAKKNKRTRNKVERPENWVEPTKMIHLKFMDWMLHANGTTPILDTTNNNDEPYDSPTHPHWYYRLIGCGGMGNDGSCDKGSSEYLYDELTFFQPRETLYIVDPIEQKGIHCRFGMRGVTAEDHFDGSRNSIVVLKGHRRYILSHPNQCQSLALYPKGHPSARHSAVNWSHPILDEYPNFHTATANEIILSPGQVLYLPTDWFHYIVSLDINYQCNTRSGITNHYTKFIKECGF